MACSRRSFTGTTRRGLPAGGLNGSHDLLPTLGLTGVGGLTDARDLLLELGLTGTSGLLLARNLPSGLFSSLSCGYGEKTNEEDDSWDPPVILKDGFG